MKDFKIDNGKSLHFIGIGGIGMSGLAQLFASAGCTVSGSDRAAENSENRTIFAPLHAQGIKIYPQDGSYISDGKPDFLIYSTAIEEDNPDLIADVPHVHRSEALAQAIAMKTNQQSVAVTGSCGKTTVTAWLAETLFNLGADPACLDGGLVNRFRSPENAGNYYSGKGNFFVFEADESDKSLLAYAPDYALILNIGTDHYSRDELIEVFGTFASQVKKGIVIDAGVFELIKDYVPEQVQVSLFAEAPGTNIQWYLTDYSIDDGKAAAEINGKYNVSLPVPGYHNALNAVAVMAMADMLGYESSEAAPAVENFSGVWRRFDCAGTTPNGARVFDDYAHNPEKIVSCIKAAQEITDKKVLAIFQPHGFGPLGFMRDELFRLLEKNLREQDIFIFVPPYYAGGTSSFKPTSEEVVENYNETAVKKYLYFKERHQVDEFIEENAESGDVVLILGARDNSLSDWAVKLVQ
jgi:UDP-N-acetylmuramate--alanine ligase